MVAFAVLLFAADATSSPTSSSPASEPTSTLTPVFTLPATRDRIGAALDQGLGIAVRDDWFQGAVGVVLRPRLTFMMAPLSAPGFSMSMIRPQLRATAWQKRIKLFVQPELADTARILDAEVSVQPWPFFGVRVGRFVTSFSRSFATPVPRLKFPDFAASNTLFRADRDVGVSVQGSFFDRRLDYDVGVFNGSSLLPAANDRGIVMVLGRVSAHPLGFLALDENACKNGDCPLRIGIGANAYYRAIDAREVQPDETIASIGVERQGAAGLDFALTAGPFQLQAEVFYRARFRATNPQLDQLGGYVHAAVTIVPTWLEVAVRGDVIDANLRAGRDRLIDVDALLTTYLLGEHAKVWLQYSYRNRERNAVLPNGFAPVLQSHVLTLQLQLWI